MPAVKRLLGGINMNKFQTKIMNMDFKKTIRRFILLSLIIVVLGGVLTGFMFRTQAGEAIMYHQAYENSGENEIKKITKKIPGMTVKTMKAVNRGMIMKGPASLI